VYRNSSRCTRNVAKREWVLKILSVRAAVSGIWSRHISRQRSQVCRTEEEDEYTPPLLLVLLSTESGS
jgi:hypothetical protein